MLHHLPATPYPTLFTYGDHEPGGESGRVQASPNHDTPTSSTEIFLPQRLHVLAIGMTSTQQRPMLRAEGYTFSGTASLLEGYAQATHRLDPAETPRPLLILLDLRATEPGFPELVTPLLIAVLARQMRLGALHPAWLVGITSELTPELEAEAEVAGCHVILPAPLTDAARTTLRSFMTQAPLPPHHAAAPATTSAIQAYQIAAQRVIDAVHAAQIHLWTAEDVRAVLAWLTLYPGPRRSSDQRQPGAQARRALKVLGGSRAAYDRLHRIAEQWHTRYPLHSTILDMFLTGYERREIVKFFVEQGLYEDSRIYACIKELPERIAAQLRVEQVTRQEDNTDDWGSEA